MKTIELSKVKDGFTRCLQEAQGEEVIITRRGKAVGVLIGFASDEDYRDYLLENSPAFLDEIAKARRDIRAGKGKVWRISTCRLRLTLHVRRGGLRWE